MSLRTRDRVLPCNPKVGFLSSEEHAPRCSSNFPLAQFRYFDTVDTLSVYLRNVTAGLIADTWDVHPGLLVDFDKYERPVALNISSASLATRVHFYNTADFIDGKRPLQLDQIYDPYGNVLTLWFCKIPDYTIVETSDANISIIEDEDGNWIGFRIKNPVAE